jgi:IS1 family transposase
MSPHRATHPCAALAAGDGSDRACRAGPGHDDTPQKTRQPLVATRHPRMDRPLLARDDRGSCVGRTKTAGWNWRALERQTRRLVGLACSERSAETCRARGPALPADDRTRALGDSACWKASGRGLPPSRPRTVGQASGQTALVERVHTTLRQRCAHGVRQPLSCSKEPARHQGRLRRFVDHRNQARRVKHAALSSQD